MLSAEHYRRKVLDGRKHIAEATLDTMRQEHERCQRSLEKHSGDISDPQYVVKLQRCYLSEEEFLAQEAIVRHYRERCSVLMPEPTFSEV